jgi:hypothetical protein
MSPGSPLRQQRLSSTTNKRIKEETAQVVVSEFISLDGVVQAPGGPDEDTTGGFRHGGWSMKYFDPEVMGQFPHPHRAGHPDRPEPVRFRQLRRHRRRVHPVHPRHDRPGHGHRGTPR